MSEVILADFDSRAELYGRITTKAAALIVDLLRAYGINVHSVASRTKERASLAKKLSKKDKAYSNLDEITDISGVRIVTYFDSDVDRVVEIIRNEFEIDEKNSVDKRLLFDPDQFGYLSTHHVVTLTSNRAALQEYRWFNDAKFEIQTRSILQHAWAEIEHDLGYKSTYEVPRHIRRKFSRLAGLLELADSEFSSIRNELSEYDLSVAERITAAPDTIEINKSSLIAFAHNNRDLMEIDQLIANHAGWKLIFDDDDLATNTRNLSFAGVHTIGQLEHLFNQHKQVIIDFAMQWLKHDRDDFGSGTINQGIGIFYLVYVLLALSEDYDRTTQYFSSFGIGDDAERTANQLQSVYAQVKGRQQHI